MRKIRIVDLPGGQAPEHIRKAWIGLEILVDESEEQPSIQGTGGVVDRGASPVPKKVFSVFATDAFAALKEHDRGAWAWWNEMTPHLFIPGRHLLFDEASCVLVED